MYVGSNSYITFGAGYTQYSALTASSSGWKGLLIGAADNSYQRVYAGMEGPNKYRVRYEGATGTSGIIDSPSIVWEVTFYSNNQIMVAVGQEARFTTAYGTTGLYNLIGLTNGVTWAAVTPAVSPFSSFVFETPDNGAIWVYRAGSYL